MLADKLAYCRFLFETARTPTVPSQWTSHWIRPEWPIAIRIEMGPLEPDAARLQPMTVTANGTTMYGIFDGVTGVVTTTIRGQETVTHAPLRMQVKRIEAAAA